MQRIVTCAEMRERITDARQRRRSIGLVPTMGALHAGHLSLVTKARSECDLVVATIFVNPTQFGPEEDFSRYPRTFDADCRALETARADVVFTPTTDEMYPPDHTTFVEVGSVSEPLEGLVRPGHFRGVATVVLKLFHLVPADVAYFGHKDYQQTLVLRRMVRDLDLPIEIRVCPTVREADGLAMSSRNRYLTPDDRQAALAIPQSLHIAQQLVASGTRDAATIAARMRERLLADGRLTLDYAVLVDPESLAPVTEVVGTILVAIAARVGNTRLIDNELLEP